MSMARKHGERRRSTFAKAVGFVFFLLIITAIYVIFIRPRLIQGDHPFTHADSSLKVVTSYVTSSFDDLLFIVKWQGVNQSDEPRSFHWEDKYLGLLLPSESLFQSPVKVYFPPELGTGEEDIKPGETTPILWNAYRISRRVISIKHCRNLYWGNYDKKEDEMPVRIPLAVYEKKGEIFTPLEQSLQK